VTVAFVTIARYTYVLSTPIAPFVPLRSCEPFCSEVESMTAPFWVKKRRASMVSAPVGAHR